ncbi:TKL family protein kinase [Histomonas meleagridis]|uniref:TKL family protein kinase n=1 Tax=Histomonas meleagridis TaxID=135588 RepID=UPI00355A502B|nr:TKL family protein kinase [Histomonas meleagridis]KAH0801487.1 TKL family protein kinase [Histomonas meleagridis]
MSNSPNFEAILIFQQPAYDAKCSAPNKGGFCLSKLENTHFLSWIPINDSNGGFSRIITKIPSQPISTEFKDNSILKFEVSTIKTFSFEVSTIKEEHHHVKITIEIDGIQGSRVYKVYKKEYFSLFLLLQKIVSMGIAIPQRLEDQRYSLYFLKTKGFTFNSNLNSMNFTELKTFADYWNSFLKMTGDLIVSLNKSNSLPNLSIYPFGLSSNAIHQEILSKLKKEYARAHKKAREPLSAEDLFDKKGKLKDVNNFRKHIYDFGIKNDVLTQTVGLMFGLYDLNSTREERKTRDNELYNYFNQIGKQLDNICQTQISQNARFQKTFRVIDNDVDRTDRTSDIFKSRDKPGLIILTKLLRSYLVYNPSVGYLQGMNDIFVPLIRLFFPEWNSEGHPVKGDRLLTEEEIEQTSSKIFWHFSYMLRHINHEYLLSSIGSVCNEIADQINSILFKINPSLIIWLKKTELSVALSDFKKEVSIGKGAYSEVFLATHIPTQIKTALKVLTAKKLEGSAKTYFVREVMILASCRNPFLLQLMGFTDTYPYCIVSQYVESGSLYDALKHKPGSPELSNTDKSIIAMCVAYGMNALHQQKIIHRDLKSLNILLDSNCLPKIIDFGISRFHGEEGELVTSTIGTPHWMAPEMFNSTHYDSKVDVYSYGILLWEMLTEATPFDGMSAFQIMAAVCQKGQRPDIPESTPKELTALIEACWSQDPAQRPTFDQIYQAFSTCSVSFANTDPSKVEVLANYIVQFEEASIGQQVQVEIPDEPIPEQPQEEMKMSRRHGHKKHDSRPPLPDKDKGEKSHHSRRSSIQASAPKPTSGGSGAQTRSDSGHFSERKSKQRQTFSIKTPKRKYHMSDSSNNDKYYDSSNYSHHGGEDDKPAVAVPLEKLESPKSHGYKRALKAIVAQLTVDKGPQFFKYINSNLLSQEISERTRALIMKQLVKLIKREPDFAQDLVDSNCINVFPFNVPAAIGDIIQLLIYIAQIAPETIPLDSLRVILSSAQGNEKKLVTLLAVFNNTMSDDQSFVSIVQSYVMSSQQFLASDQAATYLNILYSIYINNQSFSFVSQAFATALKSEDPNIIRLSYFGLCNMQFNQKILPLELIVTHFDMFPYEATSLIARMASIPNSTRLINGLLKAANTTPVAVYLLCKIADSSKGAQLLINNPEWLTSNIIDVNYQLRIFLSIFVHQELRAALIQLPNLIEMFTNVVELCPYDSIQAIVTVIRRLSTQIPEFIVYLSQTGFLSMFFQNSFGQYNPEMTRIGLLLLDNLIRVSYLEDYLDVIPYFPTILQMDQQIQASAVCTLVVLSQYEQTNELLKSYHIPEIVAKLKLPQKYEQYQKDFIEHFKK